MSRSASPANISQDEAAPNQLASRELAPADREQEFNQDMNQDFSQELLDGIFVVDYDFRFPASDEPAVSRLVELSAWNTPITETEIEIGRAHV